MTDGTGLAEAVVGLEGFPVPEVPETETEVVITVERERIVGCWRCGRGPKGRTA